MRSASTIRMDFQKAKRCAEELEEIAAGMRRLADGNLSDSFRALSFAWRGEAAVLYLKKGERLKMKIRSDAKDLEKTAAAIRSTAKRTYDAEMKAYQLALHRSYNK